MFQFELIRDTPAGQLLRTLGFKSWLLFPDERPDFQMPTFAALNEVGELAETTKLERSMSKVSATIDVPKARLPEKGLSDAKIVSWYDKDDTENPRNWSDSKKNWTMLVIVLYTFVVYCSASIIAPTAEFAMARYNVSQDVASLGLSMYVFGCKYYSFRARAMNRSTNRSRWCWPNDPVSNQ